MRAAKARARLRIGTNLTSLWLENAISTKFPVFSPIKHRSCCLLAEGSDEAVHLRRLVSDQSLLDWLNSSHLVQGRFSLKNGNFIPEMVFLNYFSNVYTDNVTI